MARILETRPYVVIHFLLDGPEVIYLNDYYFIKTALKDEVKLKLKPGGHYDLPSQRVSLEADFKQYFLFYV